MIKVKVVTQLSESLITQEEFTQMLATNHYEVISNNCKSSNKKQQEQEVFVMHKPVPQKSIAKHVEPFSSGLRGIINEE
jgi:hypothetical protein